jgi:hypothetical protein
MLSTWDVALSACMAVSDGATSTAFECLGYCTQFATIQGNQGNAFIPCALIEVSDGEVPELATDPGSALLTDAGNIVMCCPVLPNQFACGASCVPPFM